LDSPTVAGWPAFAESRRWEPNTVKGNLFALEPCSNESPGAPAC